MQIWSYGILQGSTAEGCLFCLWFSYIYNPIQSGFTVTTRLLSVMSHSPGTISIYIRSFTTLPATLTITAQELLQLASLCFYSGLHLQSQKNNNAPRIRLPRLQTYLSTQSIACFPSPTNECYCKCATSALLVEGSPVSMFFQTVTSRRYLDSAQAGRLAAGCSSSGELHHCRLLRLKIKVSWFLPL